MNEHDIWLLFNPIDHVPTVLLLIFWLPLLYQLIISGTFFEIQNIEYIKHTFFFN